MKRIENECLSCTDIGLPCLGSSCTNRNVVRFYCDKCKEESTLYYYGGKELCGECILEELVIVEDSDCW